MEGTTRGLDLKSQKKPSFVLGNNHLLVIGIDEYKNFPKLFNAKRDAQAVAEVLLSKYQFSKDHFHELYNEDATQGNILAKLEQLSDTVSEKDSVLIYFSGHGEFNEKIDVGFWIPVDGKANNPGSFISFQFLQSYLNAIKSFHTFVIADSCYAGTMFTVRSTKAAKDRMESIPSRWLLTAGRNEVVRDGKPGDHSPFADAVLFKLRNNTEERIQVSAFCQAVITDVVSNAEQTPRGEVMHGVGHRGGEFMFRLKAVKDKVYKDNYIETEAEGTTKGGKEIPIVPKPEPKEEVTVDISTLKTLKDIKRTIQILLADRNFDKAFEVLNEIANEDSRFYNSLILLQGRYNQNKRNFDDLMINDRDAEINFNRISKSILNYIKDMEEEDLKPGTLQ